MVIGCIQCCIKAGACKSLGPALPREPTAVRCNRGYGFLAIRDMARRIYRKTLPVHTAAHHIKRKTGAGFSISQMIQAHFACLLVRGLVRTCKRVLGTQFPIAIRNIGRNDKYAS